MLFQKINEVEAAEHALSFITGIEDKVQELNYMSDEYLDALDRVMASLELTKERYEEMRK